MLGHSRQIAGRRDVRKFADGGQTQGERATRRPRLHAHPLRPAIRARGNLEGVVAPCAAQSSALCEILRSGRGIVQPVTLSIIIPTLNEAEAIVPTLASLQSFRGQEIEIIVVDGGSTDDTLHLTRPLADRIAAARRGRASQMNAGAAIARGVLLFLHADTQLLGGAVELIRAALSDAC